MKVLSLFDGMSCGRIALERAGIKVDEYFASEIDKYAIKVSTKNYPDIIHIGDVREVEIDLEGFLYLDGGNIYDDRSYQIDLLIGGSPCQDLSIAKKNRKGLEGERSGLFWEYLRILRQVKPKWFLLENVASMPKDARDIITRELGVEPILINSSLVSAQSRKRLYWTNIPGVKLPDDKGIFLKDILQYGETNDLKSYCLTSNYQKMTEVNYRKGQGQMIKVGNINPSGRGMNGDVYDSDGKSPTLTTNKGEGIKIIQRSRGFNKGGEFVEKSPTLSSYSRQENNKLHIGDIIRKLTPVECERLQTVPDNYTDCVSNSQRYKMLGNGWTVDVVAHIFSFLK